MAGMPQTQRDQVMLFVGIIGLALAGAWYYFVYTPKQLELEELTARVERLDATNRRAEAIIASGSVEQLRAEAAALRENLVVMRTLTPCQRPRPRMRTSPSRKPHSSPQRTPVRNAKMAIARARRRP